MVDKLTLSAREAAAAVGVSYVNMLQIAKRQDFPAVWVGRRVVIPRAGLERWLAERRGGDGSII